MNGKDNNGVIVCRFDNCGRRFEDAEKLNDHINRRHVKQAAKEELTKRSVNVPGPPPKALTPQLRRPMVGRLPQLARDDLPEAAKSLVGFRSVHRARDGSLGRAQSAKQEDDDDEERKSERPSKRRISLKRLTPMSSKVFSPRSSKGQESTKLSMTLDYDTLGNLLRKRPGTGEPEEEEEEIDPDKFVESSDDEEFRKAQERMETQLAKFDLSLVLESRKKLTREWVLEKSGGFDTLSEVTHLVLREQGLYVFEGNSSFSTSELVSLESLSLSHNHLINLFGLAKCYALIELNINYNRIEDLSPLCNLEQLERLYASNNLIRHIVGLESLKKLK